MTKNTIVVIKIISAFFGISIMLGFVWFGDYYASKSVISIIFEMSTGISLLIVTVLPISMVKNFAIRIFMTGLIVIGAASFIYRIPRDLQLINGPDYGAIIFKLIVLFLMIAILRYIFKGIKEENSEKKGDAS